MGGHRGYRAQSFAETHSGFRLGIKQGPDAPWVVSPLEEARLFEITGAETVRVKATVRDVNGGTAKTVCVKPEDTYANIGSDCETELDVLLDDTACLGTVAVTGAGTHEIAAPVDGGWHTLTLTSRDGKYHAKTNPFGPSLIPGYKLYFGDIHAQSSLCDGTNSPRELYQYAQTAAGLDFASVSSHDMELDGRAWGEIMAETKAANQPGRFVTLLGYEWSGQVKHGGDHNIYFKGDEGPLVRNSVIRSPWCIPDTPPESHDLRETIAAIRKDTDEFMVVPHCGGRAANFDFYDPEVMPVFEIHSTHRNYEHVWHDAVRRGLRMGLIGGSDDHRGAVGDSALTVRDNYFSSRCGLTCVYAKELTRGAIWDAIQRRRTYATNGPRIALAFTLGGAMMGDDVHLSVGSELRFEFSAVCDGFFDRAEFYVNDEMAARYQGELGFQNRVTRYSNTYSGIVKPGVTFYCVKIVQADGGTAWSSPIFVHGTSNELQ
jgi:hypothetical protein